MSGARILWGQLCVVLALVVLSWWVATEWVAWQLAFQPELGQPWFTLFHHWPVYAPPLVFWWWYEFDAYAPHIFSQGGWIAGSGGVLAFLVAVAMSVRRAREARRAATYGSARWASAEDLQKSGLLDPDGVVLGCHRKTYLRHNGPEHVLCFAPTRSGKGVGLVIPTLLTWPGSAIVHDIKEENWQETAGFRGTFSRVLLFDPTNPRSDAYNPLLEIRRGEWEVRDAQNVADVLVDPEGSLERRSHWEKTSHSLLDRGHPACPVCGEGQDPQRGGKSAFRSKTPDRDDITRHDAHEASGRGGAAPCGGVGRSGTAQQVSQRTVRCVVYRHVISGPVS